MDLILRKTNKQKSSQGAGHRNSSFKRRKRLECCLDANIHFFNRDDCHYQKTGQWHLDRACGLFLLLLLWSRLTRPPVQDSDAGSTAGHEDELTPWTECQMPSVTRLATTAAPRHCGAPLLKPLQGAHVRGGTHLPHTHTAICGAAEHQGTLGLRRARRTQREREEKVVFRMVSLLSTVNHRQTPLERLHC